MRVVVLCEYDGPRHSNPVREFPNKEVVGPFGTIQEAAEYEETHRFEGCENHSIIPMIEVRGQ